MKDPLAEELKEKFNEWEYNDDGSRHWYTDWQALAEYVRRREIERAIQELQWCFEMTAGTLIEERIDELTNQLAVLKSQLGGSNEER